MTQISHTEPAARPASRTRLGVRVILAAILAVGIALAIAHWLMPAGTRQGEVIKVDPTAHRVVIREIPSGQPGTEGVTLSVQVKQEVDIGTLKSGDRIEFAVDTAAQEWTIRRANQKP